MVAQTKAAYAAEQAMNASHTAKQKLPNLENLQSVEPEGKLIVEGEINDRLDSCASPCLGVPVCSPLNDNIGTLTNAVFPEDLTEALLHSSAPPALASIENDKSKESEPQATETSAAELNEQKKSGKGEREWSHAEIRRYVPS